MSLEAPLPETPIDELVDWLELRAFLAPESRASLDEIWNVWEIGQDEEVEEIAEDDAIKEDLYAKLADEVQRRKATIGDAGYPFSIGRNGEYVERVRAERFGQMSYLLCLVIHHSWTGGKLIAPARLRPVELQQARTEFEIISAVAAIGYADGGPSFLIGTNRAGAQNLLIRVGEICDVVGEGAPRAALHPEAPARANDDGVDVIAVHLENDGPPARSFNFCQAAAGANYEGKPIINLIERFLETWFDIRPPNHDGIIFTPALFAEAETSRLSRTHGRIVHRLRLPTYASRGAEFLAADANLLYYVDDIDSPKTFLENYANRVGVQI